MSSAERNEPNAPAVVFLHGLFGTPGDFEVVKALLPACYRLFAPDLPIASGAGDSAAELVGFLDRRLQSAGIERAVLVGNSLGGHVALSFALQFPDRVAGLVLTGSASLFERGFETATRLLFIAGSGHAPMIERPSAYAFHLGAFLNDVLSQAGRSGEVAA